ncbi:hypothetical protein PIB30_052931 [Stylosanthes scabra]|uniref:Transcription factor CBF/NF-Y/archaeal histone domain-containing protein n=1 Tax=Stylosanthes scabra TaxID=79078 RepID=A0ABU6WGR6_9FABA|nr:hypothetical protein [Stylosanthes scabra]
MESDGSSCHGLPQNSSSYSSNGGRNPQEENLITLPMSSVHRIMRQIVPKHAKICDDTKDIVRSCICEFIGTITDEAIEHCNTDQRSVLTADDIIRAMSSLGFKNYAELLEAHLRHVRYMGTKVHYTDVPQCPGGNVVPPPTPTHGGAGGLDPPTSFARGEIGKVSGEFGLASGARSTSDGNVGGSGFDPLAYLNRDKFL